MSNSEALPRAVIRRRRVWPGFRPVMDWLQSAFLVFVIASALVGIGLLVRHAFNFYAEGVRQIIDTRYELKRSECLRNGGDATSLQHDLYGPYIVTCWRNDRPLYTTKFPHPLDG